MNREDEESYDENSSYDAYDATLSDVEQETKQ